MTSEIYISTDIETDGPIPGPHSMLSIGSAAYTPDKELIATFSANLKPLPGATGHPKTMKWWSENPAAWSVCQVDPQPAPDVMHSYHSWVQAIPGRPIFVAYPAAFDFMFIYWYLMHFVGDSPFKHSALDIRSYAMAFLKRNYLDSGKKDLPVAWLEEKPLTHVALDDAIQQGELFCNLLQNNLQREH